MSAPTPGLDVKAIRRDFPILRERVNGRPLAWFDNAATTQKPQAVIDRLVRFYEHENSNIHRAAHELAARATDAYEAAREKVRGFLGAASAEEILFVRGATEGINLVANTWGEANIGEGDEIIISHLEHHANSVPWQILAARKGAKLRVIPVDETGQVILSEYRALLGPRTKLVAVTQVANALGTVVPVHEIVAFSKAAGAVTLVDGAQSVSHLRVNVQAIGTDFFVFSGHKVFGPTGIGALYGRKEVLERIPPWQGGGNMIQNVTFERSLYQPPPAKFEAGTGNIADAAGLGAALDYVQALGLERIAAYEHQLLAYAIDRLAPIKGVRIIGTAPEKASVLSFVLAGHTPEAVGRALNEEGIVVRSGHHCAQPILRRFGVEATVRASLAFCNTCEEVDRFIEVIRRLARACLRPASGRSAGRLHVHLGPVLRSVRQDRRDRDHGPERHVPWGGDQADGRQPGDQKQHQAGVFGLSRPGRAEQAVHQRILRKTGSGLAGAGGRVRNIRSSRRDFPRGQGPKPEATLMCPARPRSTRPAPHAWARARVRSRVIQGSFRLPTTKAGTSSVRSGMGPKWPTRSLPRVSAGATSRAARTFACGQRTSRRAISTAPSE